MTDGQPLILIVDDEKVTSHTMTMALEALGYEAIVAENGEQGLKMALEQHPRLIILDYHMKGMDGITVLRKLRADPWGSTAPVIMASNVYDVDLINAIMELNVPDYVLKSDINLDDLVKLVGKYVPAPHESQPGQ
jgi:CheY-like chemotaxis protein